MVKPQQWKSKWSFQLFNFFPLFCISGWFMHMTQMFSLISPLAEIYIFLYFFPSMFLNEKFKVCSLWTSPWIFSEANSFWQVCFDYVWVNSNMTTLLPFQEKASCWRLKRVTKILHRFLCGSGNRRLNEFKFITHSRNCVETGTRRRETHYIVWCFHLC